MLCRWLAVLILAGFLLVIEGIAVSQGTINLCFSVAFTTSVIDVVAICQRIGANIHEQSISAASKSHEQRKFDQTRRKTVSHPQCGRKENQCFVKIKIFKQPLVFTPLTTGTFAREQKLMGGNVFGNHNVTNTPTFETNVTRHVTTAVGQTAFLHCRVYQLGDKEVSWMRKRDMHILSAGIYRYTSDMRFQVIHPEKSENWTLQIKSPQERDSGVYECQVSTEPKMSLNYSLNVVEARARISDQSDMHVKTGSLLTLTCLMSQGPHDLGTVAWFHGSQPVVTSPHSENDIDGEPRITVETEWSDALTSRLRINHVKPNDSGNYSCVPTVAKRASINVHVINGEHPAAMQHGNTAAGSPTSKTVLVMLAFFLGQLR